MPTLARRPAVAPPALCSRRGASTPSSTTKSRAPRDARPRSTSAAACRPTRRGAPAMLRFGGPMQIRNGNHDHRGLPLVETTLQDFRYGLRALRKNPAYFAGRDCDACHRHRRRHRGLQHRQRGPAAAAALRRSGRARPRLRDQSAQELDAQHRVAGQLRRLEGAEHGLHRHRGLRAVQPQRQRRERRFLTGLGEPQGLKALGVTGNLFTVLGAAPLLGRTFTDEETFEGKARVVILSYGLWQSAFAGDPGDRRPHHHAERPRLRRRRRHAARRSSSPAATSSSGCRSPTSRGVRRVAAAALARRRRAAEARRVARAGAARRWTAIARGLEQQYPDTNTQMGVRLERSTTASRSRRGRRS